MSLADCKTCKNQIIENEANGKTFYYCRTCKDERTVWGYELPKVETKSSNVVQAIKDVLDEVRNNTKDNLYGTYGGGHNQQASNKNVYQDPYYGYGSTTAPGQPTHLTQKEIDELFNDMYQGAD